MQKDKRHREVTYKKEEEEKGGEHLKASRKTIAVAYQKSGPRLVENPPRMTTVAHVNASVPRPLPALSRNATVRTKWFSCLWAATHGATAAGDGAGC